MKAKRGSKTKFKCKVCKKDKVVSTVTFIIHKNHFCSYL